ncbi:MAG: alkaline phosphatase family protein [SAR324 cluster bacterium]|nr:alkaline phosphatase family protein [SAR324 cluster bacterium]
MAATKNILFIMCDQLRADYLGCYGHPSIKTPHLDRLAEKGVVFTRAYVQAPICGPSRMSFYTGRYMMSHGSVWNNVPLSLDNHTIGDYLRPEGMQVALVGKTHMSADLEGMERVRLDPNSLEAIRLSQCGFDPVERDDGLHPSEFVKPLAYNQYLNQMGYPGDNPWHDFANSAEGPNGEVLTGWSVKNSAFPARVREEHSETPYMTNRAIDFIREKGENPWCLHLSYIKPHWPYMAPAPYHEMYNEDDMLPVNTSSSEAKNPHPVYQAFRDQEESITFRREDARKTVIPAYMGLVSQIDHHLGRLFKFLEEEGRMDDTMIVFTSDHGDYLGDHGLGEKQLFHEESVRIPLIIYDPSNAADPTRGRQDSRFVESIDLIPTFIESVGGKVKSQRLEGRSLRPLLHDQDVSWRQLTFSEADYSFYLARAKLGVDPHRAKAYMVRSEEWKYIFYEGYSPQLFDLKNDPNELHDLGEDNDCEGVRREMAEHLFSFFRNRRSVITLSEEEIIKRAGTAKKRGIYIGVWDCDQE